MTKHIYDISASAQLIDEYIYSIESINKGVKLGLLYYNDNLLPQSIDNIVEYVYSNKAYKTSEPINRSMPDEPPYFNITYTCHRNADELQNVYEAYVSAMMYNPSIDPWLATSSYWASKVMEGGDWDYKRELGWNNEYKIIIGGVVDYVPGEDIGNIHYGYTGTSIDFTPSILLSVAGIVQILSGTARPEWFDSYFDDLNDQAAIQRGIDMYNDGF